MKKLLYIFLGIVIGASSISYGASIMFPYQGGTGKGSATAGDVGKCLTISDDSPFTYAFASCGSGSGGAFSWTVNSWGNSTSTTLGFLNGFLSTASSTISSSLRLPSISQGFLYTGSTGLVQPIASSSVNLSWFNNDSGFLTSVAPTDLNSADFGDFTCNGTSCTLDTIYLTSYTSPYEIATGTIAVSDLAFFGKTSGRTTLEGVATTTLTASSPLSLSNPVVKVGGSNSVLTLDTSGSWTGSAGSVANALTAGTGLTSAGTYNGATARTFSLDTANANSWSVLQTFNYSSSTAYSSFVTASSTQWIGGGLQACDATTGKLNWDSTTKQFKCDTDQTGGSSFTGAANSIVTTDGSGNLIATGTQLTVGNIIGTTTASSYFLGKVGIGSTTPSYALTVAPTSGVTAGRTMSVYDATPSTGITTLTIRRGADAGVSNLLQLVDNSENIQTAFDQGGTLNFSGGLQRPFIGGNGLGLGDSDYIHLANNSPFIWSSTNDGQGTADLGIYRNAAGVLEVNNGTPGSLAKIVYAYSSSTVYSSFITASTTNLLLGNATFSTTTTGCLQTGSTGIVYAGSCATGLSSYDAWTHPSAGVSATTTTSFLFGTTTDPIGNTALLLGRPSGSVTDNILRMTAEPGSYTTGIEIVSPSGGTYYTYIYPGSMGFYSSGGVLGFDITAGATGGVFTIKDENENNTFYENQDYLQWNDRTTGIARFDKNASRFNFGTTTSALSVVTIASSTAPQLSLSAGAGLAQWAFRNAGGDLFFSTTTVAGTATTTTSALTILGSNGNIGIGTTSPWGLLSIANPTITDYSKPLFTVSTSSGSFGQLFSVFATSSNNLLDGNGSRVVIGENTGYYGYKGGVDQLYVNGRINTGDWKLSECNMGLGDQTQITADTARGCEPGGWNIAEDGAGVLDMGITTTANSSIQTGYMRLRTGATGSASSAGDGMAINIGGGISEARYGSSTPVFETVARLGAMQNATSTMVVLGTGRNYAGLNPGVEIEPAAGFYFTASTTAKNGTWWAVCDGNATKQYFDTGVASSTVTTGDNTEFTRFRIEMGGVGSSNQSARFYIQQSGGALTLVASCTGMDAANNQVNPASVSIGRVTAGLSPELHVRYIRFWWKDNLSTF